MCGPEFSDLDDSIWGTYQGTNFVTIGINFAESPATVQNFVDAFGISFPVLLDTGGSVYENYWPAHGACSSPFPLDLIIDPSGIIRYWKCEYDPVSMVNMIDVLLAEGTGVEESASAPLPAPGLRLEPNRPNPFNPMTEIVYELHRAGTVRISILDVSGRLVRNLTAGRRPAGRHVLQWDGRDDGGRAMPSGTYLYRLSGPDGERTRKLTLLR